MYASLLNNSITERTASFPLKFGFASRGLNFYLLTLFLLGFCLFLIWVFATQCKCIARHVLWPIVFLPVSLSALTLAAGRAPACKKPVVCV